MKKSYLLLKVGDIKEETESTTAVVQKQVGSSFL
jgi:hypothetical protein